MECMERAYGMLFMIENTLRKYIEDKMIEKFGPKWKKTDTLLGFRQRPLSRSNFYELENYLRTYHFDLPRDFISTLRKLYPIRNYIAHCQELKEEEYQILNDSYQKIMDAIYARTH
jgi:hypothetical protein